jgi:FkbM family methyltransferase
MLFWLAVGKSPERKEGSMVSEFTPRFFNEFFESIHSNQGNNWCARRFGPESRDFNVEAAASNMRFVLANFDHYARLYDQLADQPSRDYLLRFVLYKVLGHTHVRFPQITPTFWNIYNSVESYLVSRGAEPFPSQWLPVPIYVNQYQVCFLGHTLNLRTSDVSLLETLLLEQYTYRKGPVAVSVRPGDVVIDAGACWGDTTLAFSAQAGKQGRVFGFEMTEENLSVLRGNLADNPALAETVEIMEAPLAATSGQEFWVNPMGAASRLESTPGSGKRVVSTSIDDFVRNRNLPTVDFIKFDIEGAEKDALLGARETIQRYRPTLAVSVYHKTEDIIELPTVIKSLCPHYKLYLHGVCLNHGETVLFATARD